MRQCRPGTLDCVQESINTFPFFRMAIEMILLSLEDIRPKKRVLDKSTIEQRKYNRRIAIRWFNARDESVFGYGWCLSLTGANPKIIREYLSGANSKKIECQKCGDLFLLGELSFIQWNHNIIRCNQCRRDQSKGCKNENN